MNFLIDLIGAVARIITGYIVGATGSFPGAFLTAGVVLIVGIIAYVVLLDDMARMSDPQAKAVSR